MLGCPPRPVLPAPERRMGDSGPALQCCGERRACSFPEPQASCLEDTPPLCLSGTPPTGAAPFPFRDTPSRSNAVPASCLPLYGDASPSQAQRGGSAQLGRAALVLCGTGMRASAPEATTSSERVAAR